jgi:hypothetical protein
VVGPVTRSTVSQEPVDPRAQAITDALHWIWSWRVQVARLREDCEREWGSFGSADRLEQQKASSQFSFDEHVPAVTGWHLTRSLTRVNEHVSVPANEQRHEAFRLLRNPYEHWEEQRAAFASPRATKERSAKEFVDLFPDGAPWSLEMGADDWRLGKVVSINSLTIELLDIEARLLTEQKS